MYIIYLCSVVIIYSIRLKGFLSPLLQIIKDHKRKCCASVPIFTTKYVYTCHRNINIVYRNAAYDNVRFCMSDIQVYE